MLEFFHLSWKVAMRHWSIYKKDFFSNILPTIVDPVLFIVVFGYWVGKEVNGLEGYSYLNFIAPGVVMISALYTAFFESSYGFYVRLVYENIFTALMATPVGHYEILMGEVIWVGLKGMVMSTGASLVLVLMGLVQAKYFFLMPVIGLLVGISCGAIGLVSSGYVRNINQFQTVYALLISPMFFLSGIFYPVHDFPKWLQILSEFSPLYHGVKLSQSTLWAKDLLTTWAWHGPMLIVLSVGLVTWGWKKLIPKLYV